MKKAILLVMVMTVLAVPAVTAQKINDAAIIAKMDKSDADIADAKKATVQRYTATPSWNRQRTSSPDLTWLCSE